MKKPGNSREERIRFLRENPFFWSRMGFCYDPPRANAKGEQIVFSEDFAYYRKTHDAFRDAGVFLHTTILHSGWVGDGEYDYRLTDRTLAALLEDNPDILYMPRVKLNAPPDWCLSHPEDIFVYTAGPRTAAEIAALVGTEKQDYFGFESAGYATNGSRGYRDDRPNRGGVIALQSFSSDAWREAAAEALSRLIDHIDASPYADRIVGYHIAYGMCGETSPWGAWEFPGRERGEDHGIRNTRNFVNYGLAKYGSEDALCRAWGEENVARITVPPAFSPDSAADPATFFLTGQTGRKRRDYNDFLAEENAKNICFFCRTVKKKHPDAIAGAFYGYTYLPTAARTGHTAIDTVLSSPDVDFLSSPKGYYRCLCGDPGGEQGPSYSIGKRVAWLDEIDCHTHLDTRPTGKPADFSGTRTLLLREGIKNLSRNQGFWWMDLGEGWYDDARIMATIRELSDLGARIREIPHRSVAQILCVTDENSIRDTAVSVGLGGGILYEMQSELARVGAPVDTLRLCDLAGIDLSPYRLIVFANVYTLSATQKQDLAARLPAAATVVWHYLPGMRQGEDVSLTFPEKLTGFSLSPYETNAPEESFGYRISRYAYPPAPSLRRDFPLFAIEPDAETEPLAGYPDGKIMAASRPRGENGKTVLAVFPCLTTEDFRALAATAGCDFRAPCGTTVYADNRIEGCFFPDGTATYRLKTE